MRGRKRLRKKIAQRSVDSLKDGDGMVRVDGVFLLHQFPVHERQKMLARTINSVPYHPVTVPYPPPGEGDLLQ